MRIEPRSNYPRCDRTGGFSLIELLIVVFVVMAIAAIAIPNVLLAVSNIPVAAPSAGDLGGLIQQARESCREEQHPLRGSLRDPQRSSNRVYPRSKKCGWPWQLRRR